MARTLLERADAIPLLGEAFRTWGFEGASLARITEKTGLGKGSLYNFFPGGKEEMAEAVLAEIDGWFETHVFTPLATAEPKAGITGMLAATGDYFRSGNRICLVGAFALDETRSRFAIAINSYFSRWINALAGALERRGHARPEATALAEDVVLAIQGALVLARATDDPALFQRTLARLAQRLG
ncbi:TetR/AcrR family transcriptional regulator [Radicibacter daui]|uniref:TetR/AcrR family transcriptional regulator n=1 Tax=Radicibacter daui TaxID=3064829 RepID=UPI004046D835